MSSPLVYEIHTQQWLAELGVTLHDVADRELDRLAALGITHLWAMGVWARGPLARQCALDIPSLRAEYELSLPGWTDADVAGSPYAVADFTVAPQLGGDAGLAALRSRLAARNIGLILDFVPNHLAIDHPWITSRPELFVGGPANIAHGKDPYFPPWTDTAQLDYRRADTRDAMQAALLEIAARCDGVRCDMAMLVLPDIFARTWGGSAEDWDFWSPAIGAVRGVHPDFLFIAEAYWDLEARLCSLGFDYAYDKHLYDLLVHDRIAEIQPHVIGGDTARRAHFIENHDEPRAATRFPVGERHRAALALTLGLPGMRLVHDGQLAGRHRFSRIQLARRPAGDRDDALAAVYASVVPAFAASCVGRGTGQVLVPQRAWSDNPTAAMIIVVQWPGADGFELVVVNVAPHRAQCRVYPTVPSLAHHTWRLADRLGDECWVRDGGEMAAQGLFLDVPAHGAQLFAVSPDAVE